MSNLSVLSLVILLTFTYFIGSLVVCAINEAIAATFRLRPANLRIALESLSFSPDWTEYVRNTLVKSPHLEALMKHPGRYPAYIAAESFVLAVIQQLGAGKYQPGNLAAAINGSDLPASFKQVLSDLAAKSRYDIGRFEKELEQFYNNVMDRAGGWYKRKIRLILLVIAILLAIVLNLDTIRIAQGNTLGYTGWSDFIIQWGALNPGEFFIKLIGILITAFTIQLGAGWWFGLLNKAVDLRAAGKKPIPAA